VVAVTAKTEPGEILRSDGSIVVVANEGALSLGEVQLEGKRRMSAGAFLRGHAGVVALL
jgi:methionyl-tRNA formyltransferase